MQIAVVKKITMYQLFLPLEIHFLPNNAFSKTYYMELTKDDDIFDSVCSNAGYIINLHSLISTRNKIDCDKTKQLVMNHLVESARELDW